MIKVVYVISDINKALAFEWVAQYIDKEKISLSFVLLNPAGSFLEQFLKESGFEVYFVRCRGKQDWIPAIRQVYKILKKVKPQVVHCHLLQANIVGLSAAKLASIKNRIYTRHHSSFHHVYFKKGVWWDKLANKLATKIVAISGIVRKILIEWENVPESKVVLIPHGFKLSEFEQVAQQRIDDFKERQQIKDKTPVIGVISRFNELKGIQFIIPAFEAFLKRYPGAVLLLLNASGDYEKEIQQKLATLPPSSFRLIVFENDIMAAYKAMDVFIHIPIDEHSEAFGQIYVEALAAGVPSIFTRSGIANDEQFNETNAVIVDYKNTDEVLEGMVTILENKEETAKRIAAGKELARQFNLPSFINKLEKLYLGV